MLPCHSSGSSAPHGEDAVVNILTCPHCRAAIRAVMESDAWVIFLYCPECHERIDMRDGDCCVFRSYGERPCPHAAGNESPGGCNP